MTLRRLTCAFGLFGALVVASCASSTTSNGAPPTSSAATVPAAATGAASTTAAAATTTPGATTAAPVTTALPQTTVALSTTTTVAELPHRPGSKHMHFEVGPIDITPGQNNIDTVQDKIPQPEVDGWIVSMQPNLRLADGSIPPVDVVHLHHGVWLNVKNPDATAPLPERFFAAGEEKTIMSLPAPFGYRYSTSDRWVLNYMLHNLLPTPTQVWMTYDIDFIPADAPDAADMIPARPIWMDVQNGGIYPVFDVLKNSGTAGKFTFPDDATDPYVDKPAPLNEWTVDRDGVLITTAGHLHPGGLHTDLWDTRSGTKAHLFTSQAKYYEPAGAVSWDVAMTATPQDWLVAVKAGDVLSTDATYDSGLASWYESMGIMVVWMADTAPNSNDPFTTAVDRPGMLTHGHLAENDHHGGGTDSKYQDLSKLPSTPVTGPILIADFLYGGGDMTIGKSVPTIKPGGTISYDNSDAPLGNGIWHTITACKAPCNGETGIAYPIADGDITFDSGELGLGGPPTANRTTWTVPTDIPVGTYTYFCRIHPLMRGAFRISSDGA